MASESIYIRHMPQEKGLASLIHLELREQYHFDREVNSPRIKIVLFILTHAFLYDTDAEKDVVCLLKRPGVWCIPLFYELSPDQLANVCGVGWAKSFWKALKTLKGAVLKQGDDVRQFARQVAEHVRQGPDGGSKQYDAFLSHAGEVKPFCVHLKHHLQRQHGITSFLDVDDITGGPGALPFSAEIYDAIKASNVVVTILSHHFVSKRWPVEEVLTTFRSTDHHHSKALPVYYQISQTQCEEILHHARAPEGREALAWLFNQPGIEHFGKHAAIQSSEQELMEQIAARVSSMLAHSKP